MADKISDKKKQEIERLTRQLDHKEHELEERYCDVGKSIMDKLEKENQEIGDRKSTRLNSSHSAKSRMPSSA